MSSTVSPQQLIDELQLLEKEAANQIGDSSDEESLEKLRVHFLGKKGRLSVVLGAMGKLPGSERPQIGQRANILKTQLLELIAKRLATLQSESLADLISKENTGCRHLYN